ncbi:MAG: endolytic transglycosylase MltG [candidate division WS1 bacterium]|nr:endolytic transglycosylase MltG [candidate division WS1 bacterium]
MNKPTNNRRHPRNIWKLALLLAVIVVALGVAVLGWLLALQAVTLDGAAQPRIVEIDSGQSLRQIAQRLEGEGLIRHAWAFRLQAYLSNRARRLQAGTYQLSSDMSTSEIVAALATGKFALRKITCPEGFTLRETAQLLAREQVCAAPAFHGAATREAVEQILGTILPPKAGHAEGFLFPDTYLFAVNEAPQRVVDTMITAFKDKFYDPVWVPASAHKPWGNLYQVVTLASIVEREARVDSERPLIAGVLLARLGKGMPLQADATVEYALGVHRPLTLADLKVKSPYNTYLHKGLPPGPICDPGLPSLKAALNPQLTDYLFYFAPPGSQTHVFSRTFEEHSAKLKAARGR